MIALLKEEKHIEKFRDYIMLVEFIVKVQKEVFGPNYIFVNPKTKSSINTQAIGFFRDGQKTDGRRNRVRYGFN